MALAGALLSLARPGSVPLHSQVIIGSPRVLTRGNTAINSHNSHPVYQLFPWLVPGVMLSSLIILGVGKTGVCVGVCVC